MSLFKPSRPSDGKAVIRCGVVRLQPPHMTDYAEWARLRAESREFLKPWEPVWPKDDLTRTAFRRRVRLYQRDRREDHAYPFFIRREDDDTLVGGITLSNVRRGAAQTGTTGYWIGAPYQRCGYMEAALNALTRHAFERLGLHRVEAACMPDNEASKTLLIKCGFAEEGYAKAYLRINGEWRDHILFALTCKTGLAESRQSV